MDDATPAPASLIERVDDRGKIPEELRERAYQLWATVHRQNYRDVAETLGINQSTLRAWGRRDKWRERALTERLDIEPSHLRNATGATLAAAGMECAQYLLQVGSGEVEPNRARQQVCISVMHMVGYAPSHYRNGGITPAPSSEPDFDLDIDSATPDQLRELERRYIDASSG